MPAEIVRAPGHNRRRSLGWLGAAWIEWFVIHARGDIQGRPMHPHLGADFIPLSDELTAFTADVYALDEHGRRLYTRSFFSRSKGADKSGHNARFALFEALGPCRFGGWAEGGEVFEQHDFRYVYQAGEPMGRLLTYPFLRVMATEEGQAGNVYDGIYFNLDEGPLREFFPDKSDIGLTRVYLPEGGEIRPCTAASASKDGGVETWASFDETHLYKTNELRQMYDTVRRNLRKRKDGEGWASETSTMYEPGQRSVAERSHDQAKEIAAGKLPFAGFYFNHRQAPEATDIDDVESLRLGLIEAYGDASSYMDIDGLIQHIGDPTVDKHDSARYYLNQANSTSGSAFSLAAWDANLCPCGTPAAGRLITLGFDGSLVDDSTGLVGTDVETGYQWRIGLWEPSVAGGEVDATAVDATVREAFRTWSVWRMLADPSHWESWLSKWAGEFGEKKVLEWAPWRLMRLTAIALKAYNQAINAGELRHGPDVKLREHIGNAYKQPMNFEDDDQTPLWLIQKERKGSPRKNDLAYAGMLSWRGRLDALAAGAKLVKPATPFMYLPGEDED